MTVTFEPDRDPSFARYREQWEARLLAQAIAAERAIACLCA